MTEQDIAAFLRNHPEFFDQNPDLLETISVPHPHGGRAISLAERQLVSLRERARTLEAKLGELIQFGEENDGIAQKVHRLSVALLAAPDFVTLSQALHFHLREDFAVPHVALRIWGRAAPADSPEAVDPGEAVREQAANLGGPQCGPAAESAFTEWFGESAPHVRSLALVPLGETTVFGLLALGSEDPARFFPEMGTLYLRRIGELCVAGLGARL